MSMELEVFHRLPKIRTELKKLLDGGNRCAEVLLAISMKNSAPDFKLLKLFSPPIEVILDLAKNLDKAVRSGREPAYFQKIASVYDLEHGTTGCREIINTLPSMMKHLNNVELAIRNDRFDDQTRHEISCVTGVWKDEFLIDLTCALLVKRRLPGMGDVTDELFDHSGMQASNDAINQFSECSRIMRILYPQGIEAGEAHKEKVLFGCGQASNYDIPLAHLTSLYGQILSADITSESGPTGSAVDDTPDEDGWHPVHYAVAGNKFHILKDQLENGIPIRDFPNGVSFLSAVKENMSPDAVALVEAVLLNRNRNLGTLRRNEGL